jgi:glycerol-3-phosphate dehydrogenase
MSGFDAIVVGAGIQGATMAMEIASRGLRPLVLERGRPGAATSGASLGIVHGGLRHLQRADLAGWRRSRREQEWFLRELPEFVKPLTCVMPLYRGSLRSRTLFRAAFWSVDMLSGGRGALPPGFLLDSASVAPGLPIVRSGLTGAACWHEAVLTDAAAAIEAILERALRSGGACHTHTEVTDLIVDGGRVRGVRAKGGADPHPLEAAAPVVILCAGPGSRTLARRFDRDLLRLSSAMLAFNLELDLPVHPDGALALSPVAGRGRSYFIRSHEDALLAGTWYAPWTEGRAAQVSEALIERSLDDLRRCLPSLPCTRQNVRGVLAGVLPDTDGSGSALRSHDAFVDHGRIGGPGGLYTLLGVKLTTARALSQRAVEHIWPGRAFEPAPTPPGRPSSTDATPV